MLYLTEADIELLAPDLTSLRRALGEAFLAHKAGLIASKPKLSVDISPSHKYQSLCAASRDLGVAVNKWVAVVPAQAASTGQGIHATILVNDFDTGAPLAIMEGRVVTGLRTAAMSALAAEYLATPSPLSLGFVGCGLQARHHLSAILAVFPDIADIHAFSRSSTREAFAEWAYAAHGRRVILCDTGEDVVRRSELLVTTVPAGNAPFIDPDWLQPGTFCMAADLARSFHPERLGAIELLCTDDHGQEIDHPLFPHMRPFDLDLGDLVIGTYDRPAKSDRRMFIFRGHPVADLAASALVYRSALAKRVGQLLNT